MTTDELIGRDLIELRARIFSTLSAEPFLWNDRLGKERGGAQTLLEHSLAVFDLLAACIPCFAAASSPPPDCDELLTILIAAVVHDAGKASDDWQRYVRGESKEFAKHVLEAEIRRLASAIADGVGLSLGSRIEDVASCALLHDRGTRSDAGELLEWARSTVSGRSRKLADYVNHADSLASASDLMSARRFLADSPLLIGTTRTASYSIRLRGVSSAYLHDAAHKAFEAAGWRPLLFFESGTLFIGDGLDVDRESIETELRKLIAELIERRGDRLPELAVGAPLGDFLPRPEYVRPNGLRALWQVATTRVGRKPKVDPKDEAKWREQWSKESRKGRLGGVETPTDPQMQALRDVGPEACAFKLAKYVFERVIPENRQPEFRRVFDEHFGQGAMNGLTSQSTYMPVQDYALCVYPWHCLDAQRFGETGSGKIGSLDPVKRTQLLSETLARIAEQVLAACSDPLPSERMVGEWTTTIIQDLEGGIQRSNRERVEAQLAGYATLKSARPRGPLQCAQCSDVIPEGTGGEQSASLGNQGSFSNRRVAFTSSGSPPICAGCIVDLKLGQLCIGGSIEVAIVIVPRRAFTPESARHVVQRLGQLKKTVDRQLHPATMDPLSYVALSFPVDPLRVARDGRPLVECVVRPISKDKRKDRVKKLKTSLADRIGEGGGLEQLRRETNSAFGSFDELAESLMSGTANEALRADPDVRRALEKLGSVLVDFAAVTPNLVFVSLGREIGTEDDSAADKAILACAMATLIAREVDGAVAVAPLKEIRPALATRAGRTVYVPANGPARAVLGADWLRIDQAETWLRAIQSAIALRGGLRARSLLEVLRYPSRGFAVRRLELMAEKDVFWPEVWSDIEALGKVLNA